MCFGAFDTAPGKKNGKGKNKLGILLMQVRDELRDPKIHVSNLPPATRLTQGDFQFLEAILNHERGNDEFYEVEKRTGRLVPQDQNFIQFYDFKKEPLHKFKKGPVKRISKYFANMGRIKFENRNLKLASEGCSPIKVKRKFFFLREIELDTNLMSDYLTHIK